MSVGRRGHACLKMVDGNVLVAGGMTDKPTFEVALIPAILRIVVYQLSKNAPFIVVPKLCRDLQSGHWSIFYDFYSIAI